MNRLPIRIVLVASLLALVLVPVAASAQQAIKPAAVVSIANIDEQFADANYLLQATGFPELAMFLMGKDEMTKGLDTSRPIGGYVTMEGMQPRVVAFLGVKDFDTALQRVTDQLGEAKEVGDGIKSLTGPKGNKVFLKPVGQWVFASNDRANLDNVPADPTPLLEGLNKQYNVAVRLNVQNIPQPMRDMAVAQLTMLSQMSLQQQKENEDPDERQLREKLASNFVSSMTELIQQTDQVTFGWSVDAQTKRTYIDIATTAVEGSTLAQRMAGLAQMKSAFAGFMLPDATASFHLANRLSQTDIDNMLATLQTMRSRAMKELDNDQKLDDGHRAAARQMVQQLFDVVTATARSGQLQGGAVVLLAPDALNFAAGVYVADGNTVDELLRKVAQLAAAEPNFPGIQFDAAQHGDVRLHTMALPIPESKQDVRKVLGDTLQVAIGTGPQSLYLAFGTDPVGTLTQVIDKSATEAERSVPAAELVVAIKPIVQFARSVSDDPQLAQLADALGQLGENDKIAVSSQSIPRGQLVRFELQEGVLQAIGAGIKAAQQKMSGAVSGAEAVTR